MTLDLLKAPRYGGTVERQRLRHTAAFIGSLPIGGTVLDIGPDNEFGNDLSRRFCVAMINTNGDLDAEWFAPTGTTRVVYSAVFCFEVIEHLMNPLRFMLRLRDLCSPTTRVFVTYPHRPSWFWSDIHWHEMDRKRFLHLIAGAGFEEVRYKQVTLWWPWRFYLTGVRPLLRLSVGRTRLQMYELRRKL